MGYKDPLADVRKYLKATKAQAAPPPLPPPRPAHDWYERMYAKLFSGKPNLYNTMTASAFDAQAAGLAALLLGLTRELKIQPAAGGDSDATNAEGWPDWFNSVQGQLFMHPNWTWLHEECHRLLYLYACWHIASGLQDKTAFKDAPSPPSPPSDPKADPKQDGIVAQVKDSVEGGDAADPPTGAYTELHPEEDPSAEADGQGAEAPRSFVTIPLIAAAAEDEGPGGAAERYRPADGTALTVKAEDKPRLPPNIEYLLRYVGKSGVNAKSVANFVFREKALNTEVTRIEELGYGGGNWCGPASLTPIRKSLDRYYLHLVGLDSAIEDKWGMAARITFRYLNAEKVEQQLKMPKPTANLDPDTGKFVKMEDLKVERGDVIWMINKVGPISGHVSTIIQSIDASGDFAKVPAMVTWVCGNGGGAQGGTVRVQTVWRVACENPKYDYGDISSAGNVRDDKRTAYNQATKDPSEKLKATSGELGATAKPPEAIADKDAVKGVMAADAKLKDVVDKEGGVIRPKVAGTHWQVVLFKTSRFDLVAKGNEYGPLVEAWHSTRRDAKGKIAETPPTEEEKTLLDTKNKELLPKMLMWTPPGCNRNGILANAKSAIDAKFPELVKLMKKGKR